MDVPDLTHPAWLTSIGTLVGYGVILGILTLFIFVIPTLVFAAL